MGDAAAIAQILGAIPDEWNGTTFKNDNLLGREGFARNLTKLLSHKTETGEPITTTDLVNLGNAEDYLRVATNVSTTLEFFLARAKGYPIEQVFTFGSKTMSIVAVLINSAPKTVHLYSGNQTSLFEPEELELFRLQGKLEVHNGVPQPHPDEIVLTLPTEVTDPTIVDGIVDSHFFYINNPAKIKPADILVIRKRMSIPITTPMALEELRKLAGLPSEEPELPSQTELEEFYGHLQTLSGTAINANAYPIVFTAGLPSTAALWATLAIQGGGDILMSSTAYGGSSQLADIVSSSRRNLRKHTFDIQGIHTKIEESIEISLNQLAASETLGPIVVLFVEVPTNPDMKVPEVSELVRLAVEFRNKTNTRILLLIDTTFAPASQVLKQIYDLAPELDAMVFISLSKSVSRGLTTAGTLVANHTSFTTNLLQSIRIATKTYDTGAKPDQLRKLVDNHRGVEERCRIAYEVARDVGDNLINVVKNICNFDMPLEFPTKEQADKGFSSPTFSFNLPPLPGGSYEQNAAIAQRFVDLICEHPEYKPCVSFGQDNGLIYSTVPATSTQGAIKEADKAKQAVGGVQLVRLSFSPTVSVEAASRALAEAVSRIYTQ